LKELHHNDFTTAKTRRNARTGAVNFFSRNQRLGIDADARRSKISEAKHPGNSNCYRLKILQAVFTRFMTIENVRNDLKLGHGQALPGSSRKVTGSGGTLTRALLRREINRKSFGSGFF
jgi:hypothetical protein